MNVSQNTFNIRGSLQALEEVATFSPSVLRCSLQALEARTSFRLHCLLRTKVTNITERNHQKHL